jgi:hypothetical protein
LDAPEVIDLLVAGGVGVEAGLWNGQDAEKFVAEIDFEKCLRVLVEMTSSNGEGALRELIRSSLWLRTMLIWSVDSGSRYGHFVATELQ